MEKEIRESILSPDDVDWSGIVDKREVRQTWKYTCTVCDGGSEDDCYNG